MMETYKSEDNPAMARKILEQAKSKIPGDVNVLMAEIDYLYWTGDSVKARNILRNVNSANFNSADEYVNLSNFYIKEKEYEQAVTLLEKANRLSSNNFVVLYNLGVCHYSLSEKLFNQYNQLAVSQSNNSTAQEYKRQSDAHLTESARYFEEARKLEPRDLNLLNTLKAIYARQQSPKYDEIDKLIHELEN